MLSQRQFTAYGPSHWAVIAVFVVGALLLVWLGRRQTERQSRLCGRILGASTAAIYAAILVYNLIPPSIGRSVPLQLTDLATVAGAYALWSQRQWAFVLTYYWGLVLSTQALISPVLKSPDFPHHAFLAFWAIHLLVVWAAIYLTWGRGMRPQWRDYRFAVVVTVVWAVGTMAFNAMAGTNYGFLNAKPTTASLLDLMGPWPVYVLVASALVASVWALMTWPWERRGRSRRKSASG
ncbi:YwaF family protein [Mycolicibacterium sp. XJ775]